MQLDLISSRGGVMPLLENRLFVLTNINGHTTAHTSISSSVIGGIDGDTINNIQSQPRTVSLSLRIRQTADVEEAKREILRFVKLKQSVQLRWTQNNRTTLITGIVEAVDMPRWNNAVAMLITLHCEQPYWEDFDYVVQTISEAVSLHYFTDGAGDMLYFPAEGIPLGEYDTTRTKAFANDGDVAVGMELTITAIATVTNPIIYNANGDFFGVGYGTESKQLVIESGDVITISTKKGSKTVKLNGVSLLDKIKPGSTWLQLESGNNLFSINSDDESTQNMYFSLTYKQRYI